MQQHAHLYTIAVGVNTLFKSQFFVPLRLKNFRDL